VKLRKSEADRELAQLERKRAKGEKERRKALEAAERLRRRFFDSPAGAARIAFDQGDHVFQYSIDVMHQTAIVVAMVGSTTAQETSDPVEILNSVCREGWEIVNGSFVFVEQGAQSRDKFMSSGQNVAIKGATVGYYLFKRSEKNRLAKLPAPWNEGGSEFLACTACSALCWPDDRECAYCGAEFED